MVICFSSGIGQTIAQAIGAEMVDKGLPAKFTPPISLIVDSARKGSRLGICVSNAGITQGASMVELELKLWDDLSIEA